METQMKCTLNGDGKADCGAGRSQARVGRGVLYTYAVLIVFMTNVIYVASAIPDAHARDGATVASADCWARWSWYPAMRALKCGASKTVSSDEPVGAPSLAHVPTGEEFDVALATAKTVTGSDGATAVQRDCLRRYRWRPHLWFTACDYVTPDSPGGTAVTFTQKAASGIGGFVAGIAIDLIAFPRGVQVSEVPAEKLFALGLAVGPGMLAFYLLLLFFLARYTITRAQHQQTLAALDARKLTAATEEP